MTDSPHSGWTIDGRSMLPFAQSPSRARTSRPRLMEIGPQASQRGDLDQDGGRVRPGVALKAPRYGGVATTRYRYMRYANGQEELYDLARDPDQLDNRISDRRYRATRRFLRRQLTRLKTCRGAECRRRGGPHPRPDGLEAVLDDVGDDDPRRRLDQREVGERLREVAEVAGGVGVEAERRAHAQELLHQVAGALRLPHDGQRRYEPERADEDVPSLPDSPSSVSSVL